MSATAQRSALATAALASCVVGLLGVDGGLVWVVAGVFTVRSLIGRRPGIAWAIACLGAGLRWGSLSLGDVEVATRLFGPTVGAGGFLVRAGMMATLAAALVEEARSAGLDSEHWVERAAAALALIALVPAFVVSGPELATSATTWVLATIATVVVVRAGRTLAGRLPLWVPWLVAVAGIGLAEVAA